MAESTAESRSERADQKDQLTSHWHKALYKARRSRWFPQLPLLSPGGFRTFGRSFSIAFIVGSELGRTRW